MVASRERAVFFARLAEQAERYDEMTEYMVEVSNSDGELNTDERNLLSVSFKNSVGSRRAAWRILSSVIHKEMAKSNTELAEIAEEYRSTIVAELNSFNNRILDLLRKKLIGNASMAETKVFYTKMEGDYERYKAEYSTGASREDAAHNARSAYDRAYDMAKKELAVTSPIRLGLALNFSVFEYEVLSNPNGACKMAKDAFEDAIAELDNVAEETYKDSTLIMQLLRDNLTLWTSEEDGAGAAA